MSCLLLRLKSRPRKGCDFSCSWVRHFSQFHQPSPTDNYSTVKEHILTKQYFLPPPHWLSTQSSLSELKSELTFHPNCNWTRTASVEFSTRILKLYAPTDSEHKFHKTGVENCLSIGSNLRSSSLGTRSHNHYTMFNR